MAAGRGDGQEDPRGDADAEETSLAPREEAITARETEAEKKLAHANDLTQQVHRERATCTQARPPSSSSPLVRPPARQRRQINPACLPQPDTTRRPPRPPPPIPLSAPSLFLPSPPRHDCCHSARPCAHSRRWRGENRR